jgi:hypothetical protein
MEEKFLYPLYYYYLAPLGLELRASQLLGRRSYRLSHPDSPHTFLLRKNKIKQKNSAVYSMSFPIPFLETGCCCLAQLDLNL